MHPGRHYFFQIKWKTVRDRDYQENGNDEYFFKLRVSLRTFAAKIRIVARRYGGLNLSKINGNFFIL
jgi:hypothetical protein